MNQFPDFFCLQSIRWQWGICLCFLSSSFVHFIHGHDLAPESLGFLFLCPNCCANPVDLPGVCALSLSPCYLSIWPTWQWENKQVVADAPCKKTSRRQSCSLPLSGSSAISILLVLLLSQLPKSYTITVY